MNATEPSSTQTSQMIEFQPFRAWRYNADKVSFEDVIAPPYDVISPEKQKALYEESPYNCIRLILNKTEASDDDKHNRYTRARDFYEQWKKDEILIQESKPSFYLYRQEYADFTGQAKRSRIALLGKLKLEPFEKGLVIPHEKTLSGPKKDRLALMRETQTNFSPIFGLYPKNTDAMSETIETVQKGNPLYDVVDDEGVRHTLWILDDPKQTEAIQTGMASQKVYIADGHHRYTTALNYAKEMRQKAGVQDGVTLESDYLLMALVHFHDPGLVLQPTHRMISNLDSFDAQNAVEKLQDYFHLEEVESSKLSERLKSMDEEQSGFGLLLDAGPSYLATLKSLEGAKKKMPAGKAEAWYALDVNLVNYLVLAGLWSLPESLWESSIRFTHSDTEAVSAIKHHQAAAAFILKAPQVDILEKMGKTGELMPQKSTYFYPKLASGFLFYQLK